MRLCTILLTSVLLFTYFTERCQSIAEDPRNESQNALDVKLRLPQSIGGPLRIAPLIPGELLFVETTIADATRATDGNTDLDVQAQLLTEKGQILELAPSEQSKSSFDLGNGVLRLATVFKTPERMTPGTYQARIGVYDKLGKRNAVKQVPFEVLDRQTFGAFQLTVCHDRATKFTSGWAFTVGQNIHVCYAINGPLNYDGIDVENELTVLNDKNQPTKSRNSTFHVKSKIVDGVPQHFNVSFRINASEPGSFVLKLEMNEKQSGKKATYYLPIQVVEVPDQPLMK